MRKSVAIGLAVLWGSCESKREQQFHEAFAESKLDIANATVRKYAFEAFPAWLHDHPGESCPERVEDLNEYMNKNDANDPWGGTYGLRCPPNLPPGARGIGVDSPGPDGATGTADDIRSWE